MSNPDNDKLTLPLARRSREVVLYNEAVGALARLLEAQENSAASRSAYLNRAREIIYAHLLDGVRSQLVLR